MTTTARPFRVRPHVRHFVVLAGASLAVMIGTPAAGAQADPVQELAERYAPIVMLRTKDDPCAGRAEPFRPVPVDVVLGRADVVLRDATGAVVKTAPTAADLYGLDAGSALDLPGNSLRPQCDYKSWFREIADGVATSVYAHVVVDPDEPSRLALQYWFYWPFNQWNNTHESDWEMIQLVFGASTASDALLAAPIEVGYAQHTGAEQADWTSSKLQREGDHPIVYPGPGSHAAYFSEDLFLGYSSDTGFGCDDTRDARTAQLAQVIVVPDRATSASDPSAWLGYGGRWGEQHSGPNSGPEGPSLKPRWTHPMQWKDDSWRDSSLSVPASSSFAPTATGFFCGAVERGSKLYLRFLDTPWFVVGSVVAVGALLLWLARRTRWSPAPSLPIDMQRHAGEILRASLRLHRRHIALFAGIGLVFIPLGIASALVQQLLFAITPIGSLVEVASENAIIKAVAALGLGAVGSLASAVLVYAAVAEATRQIGDGGRPTVRGVYRAVFARIKPIAASSARLVAVTVGLALTVVGIPFAVLYLIRRTLTPQAIMIEHERATTALARSNELVDGHTARTLAVSAVVNGLAAAVGPLVGVVALLLWSPALTTINVISAVVYAGVMPFAGLVLALLFYDLRRRHPAR